MAAKSFLTEKDISILEERFKEIFLTREEFQKYRSELFDRFDVILKEVQTNREERTLMANRMSEHGYLITALEGAS